MKRKYSMLVIWVLLCAFVFAACTARSASSPKEEPTPEATAQATEAPAVTPEATKEPSPTPEATATPEPTPEATATPEPTEAPVLRNPLTGEVTEKDYSNSRPTAVMVELNYDSGALIGQGGVGQADIIYEFEVEKITRTMALFMDMEGVKQIVPLRSARTYFISTAMAYDAIYVHDGQSDEGVDFSSNLLNPYFTDNDNLDILYHDNLGYRLNSWPHTGVHGMATTGELILKAIGDLGTRTEHKTPDFDYGLHFTEEDPITGGETANNIRIVFPETKITNLTYDQTRGGYTGNTYGSAWTDINTGEPLCFQNVLVLASPTTVGADVKWHSVIQTINYKGNGLYYNGGECMHITWSREGYDSPYRYFDADGNELSLGVGKTYIAFVSTTYGGATHS